MLKVRVLDWGLIEYGQALGAQKALFEALVTMKCNRQSGLTDNEVFVDRQFSVTRKSATVPPESPGDAVWKVPDDTAGWLVLCEHPPVYTLGRSAQAGNLLVSEDFLREKGASLHRIERGGDVTFHGPGQLVGYPVLDLDRLGIGLRAYIDRLEQSLIETVAHWGIEAVRVEGATGVWVQNGGVNDSKDYFVSERNKSVPDKRARKIAAIGVKASRSVVMHGFALNVSTDLDWFELINPCGFKPGAVTSLERETGRKVPIGEVAKVVAERLAHNLRLD